jgi:dihydropyrimidine dehydrogenase (NAD+) subunit PreA
MLATDFVGLRLSSPIVVGSCSATDSFDGIRRAEDAGAGAVITKSIGDHPGAPWSPEDRRRYRWVPGFGLLMESTHAREVLPLDEGVELVRRSAAGCAFPVIASVFHPGFAEDDVRAWTSLCRAVEAAGAAAIQLDFFYLDFRKLSAAAIEAVRDRIDAIAAAVTVPVLPKLSIGMDLDLIDALADTSRAPGFVYLDTIRVEPYIDIYDRGRPIYDGEQFRRGRSRMVLAGESLLHYTLSFTQRIRRRTGRPLAAGGGLSTVDDVVRCLMLGAQCVHLSSWLVRRGLGQIATLNARLRSFLTREGYAALSDIIGLSYAERDGPRVLVERPLVDRRSRLVTDRCTGCGLCEQLVVCRSFQSHPYRFVGNCDGCSMCVALCPPRALELVDVGALARSAA